jgi:hypothetical protein
MNQLLRVAVSEETSADIAEGFSRLLSDLYSFYLAR